VEINKEIKETVKVYKFKFSIVMAVYNVEPFLKEAIDSVIAQDIGFEENLQIILVDDGSKDNSGVICDVYAGKYPQNIIVVHKANGGVSSARNTGLKLIEGQYVNFMDSDDKLSKNTLSSVYSFFSAHEHETDAVSIPIKWFDGKTGNHILNYKFKKGSRIIDLRKEYKNIQLHIASFFVRNEIARQICFDNNLSFAEDAKAIIKVLIEKMCLGVVVGCKYLYRKRVTGEVSALQGALQNEKWYINSVKYFTCNIIEYCLGKMGYVPKFVQFTLMYDLQWKFKQAQLPRSVLSKDKIKEYKKLLFEALSFIEDNIILEQKHIYTEHKAFILKKKHNNALSFRYRKNDAALFYQNTHISWISKCFTRFDFIKIENNILELEGFTMILGCTAEEKINVNFSINNEFVECELVNRKVNQYALDELLFRGVAFKCKFPLNSQVETYEIKLFCEFRGHLIQKKELRFGKFCPIGREYRKSYYYNNGRVLYYLNATLYLSKCGFRGRIKKEADFLLELWKKRGIAERKAIVVRIACHLLKPFLRKDIWLISDRVNKADDNGEAIFRYINSERIKHVKTYFVIDRNSSDYVKIKAIGNTIQHFSFKHKFLHLLSTVIVSSHGDDYVTNPFQKYYYLYRDLMQKPKYIFLQHGVTKDDLSDWLNKYNKNISGFVTSAKPEYQSILTYPYYYTTKLIWLTGFPRHDRLYNDEKRYVAIMPTWRKDLMGELSPTSGKWNCSNSFKQSEFYLSYNTFINNKKLLRALREYGYKLLFMPHPNLMPYMDMFDSNNDVLFLELDKQYRTIFAESNLIVTDYSSVAFDFAYLRKPVIYFHFDKDDFFSGKHVYKPGDMCILIE